MSRIAATVAATAACILSKTSPLLNDSKRNFYSDSTVVDVIPGPVTNEDSQLLGPSTVISGMKIRLSPLVENAFRAVRTQVDNIWNNILNYVYGHRNTLFEKERQISDTVKSLQDPSEDLEINSIYVVSAVVMGQIMARPSNLLVRMFLPLGLGMGTFKFLMPHTFSKAADFFWQAEKKALPGLASTQHTAVEQAEKFARTLEQTVVKGQTKYHDGVKNLRSKVGEFAGFSLSEDVTDKYVGIDEGTKKI